MGSATCTRSWWLFLSALHMAFVFVTNAQGTAGRGNMQTRTLCEDPGCLLVSHSTLALWSFSPNWALPPHLANAWAAVCARCWGVGMLAQGHLPCSETLRAGTAPTALPTHRSAPTHRSPPSRGAAWLVGMVRQPSLGGSSVPVGRHLERRHGSPDKLVECEVVPLCEWGHHLVVVLVELAADLSII